MRALLVLLAALWSGAVAGHVSSSGHQALALENSCHSEECAFSALQVRLAKRNPVLKPNAGVQKQRRIRQVMRKKLRLAQLTAASKLSRKEWTNAGDDPDVVLNTSCGILKGTWAEPSGLQSPASTVKAFRGVRFGSVTRWMPAEEYCPPPTTTIPAQADGPACPQIPWGPGQDEQCLYLDLFVPKAPAAPEPLPIVVWLHGGGLVGGSANGYYQATETLTQLWQGEAIVVACQYRLGVFGFMAIAELSKRDPRGVSGNYGILDQELCLQWVQRNALAFGGDAHRVTLLGHSSGGTSIFALLAGTSVQRGLFHQAIALSGSPGSPSLTQVEKETLDRQLWLPKTGCQAAADVVACLLAISPEKLVVTLPDPYNVWGTSDYPVRPGPEGHIPWTSLCHVDGVTVRTTLGTNTSGPLAAPLLVQSSQAEMLPYSNFTNLSVTSDSEWFAFLEGQFSPGFGPSFAGHVAEQYSKVQPHLLAAFQIDADTAGLCGLVQFALTASTKESAPIYISRTEAGPSTPIHCADCPVPLQFAFHCWDLAAATERWDQILDGRCEPFKPQGADLALAAQLRESWLTFAKTGVPTAGGQPWPAASPSEPQAGGAEAAGKFVTFRQSGAVDTLPLNATSCSFWRSHGVGRNWWWLN